MLDAMIASALKRLLDKHVHFRKRVSAEEHHAQNQKYDRFLRGRQIDYMISENFRSTGAHEQSKDSQICSIYVYRMMMSKIATLDAIKLYHQQVICLQM